MNVVACRIFQQHRRAAEGPCCFAAVEFQVNYFIFDALAELSFRTDGASARKDV